MDLVEVTLADDSTIAGINMVDEHISFQIVWPINSAMANVTSEDVLLAYELGWASWANDPLEFALDQGRHFRGRFAEMASLMGIPLRPIAGGAHWQAGHPEAHGKIGRNAFHKEVSRQGWSQKNCNEVIRGCI